MNKISYIGSILFMMILSIFCSGQVAVGQWRDHLPYNNGQHLAISDDDVFMVTTVGLMKYDRKGGELEKMSKINGLSDSGVESVAYHQALDLFVVGYNNGNIDIINGEQIFNLGDIKRKSINGDKSIYSISFNNNSAYLGCGFGIVVIDLVKKEVSETWFIGENGGYVKVNSLANDGSFIYAATDKGVYKGDFNESLVDFAKWEIITEQNLPAPFLWLSGKSFNCLTLFDGKLIVNYHDYSVQNADTLLVYDGTNWTKLLEEFNEMQSVSSNEDYLILTSKYWIKILNRNFSEFRQVWRYEINDVNVSPVPKYALFDSQNNLWVADTRFGLVYTPADWSYSTFLINGPDSQNIFDFSVTDSKIIGVMGGMNLSWGPEWDPGKFFVFADNLWTSYDYNTQTGLAGVHDLVRVVINPDDPTHFFLGSWVDGVIEYRNNVYYKTHDPSNSTLSFVEGTDYCRIGGMAFDEDGNLWVTNSLTSPQIHVLSPEGTWTSLDYSTYIGGINIGRFIITDAGVKWIILPQSVGLFVLDDNNTPSDKSDDRVKKLSVVNEEGEVISNDVFSIAQDKNGYIWVGTSKGVAVYYNPEDVFETGNLQARQIKIPRNDGTDNADILLGNDVVTSINVDGADKKWFGTQTGGVYYTSSDGLEEIHHFTRDNSPLLSNTILCTAIIPNTGEVFFGTASGIISYRSTATEGNEDYIGVYAFPNPVKPDYRGPITITGLVAGSYVKITDISGNLVTEMRSEGGQAVWYGEDLNGNRVSTGVYLVFSSNETGSKTDITKILFINGNE
jgi:hypothetical protein